eukprot:scaffold113864_cov63-Phaeocystis_antarctica.AAC.1
MSARGANMAFLTEHEANMGSAGLQIGGSQVRMAISYISRWVCVRWARTWREMRISGLPRSMPRLMTSRSPKRTLRIIAEP